MKSNPFGALRPLRPGSRVALVAPSGILSDPAHVERARSNATSLHWTPVVGNNVSQLHGYLAGTDEQRLSDLNHALADDSIDGAMRLLEDVDYASLRENPRPLIGFSDITALHAAIYRECGIVSFHGPTARGELSEFSRNSLVRAVIDHTDSCGIAEEGRALRAGSVKGRLAGGNLALVASLMGTPYSVDFDGAILVLEDIDEAVYRVDRMLRQLVLSGALAQCAALVTGDFRPPSSEGDSANRALDDVIAEAADGAGIPCLAGAPFGHISEQWTIPLGAMAELDTSNLSLRVIAGG